MVNHEGATAVMRPLGNHFSNPGEKESRSSGKYRGSCFNLKEIYEVELKAVRH